MIEGAKRREEILKILRMCDKPISGTELAGRFGVSRQVIVQDVALLRAENRDILSTYRGYVLGNAGEKEQCIRVFCVNHATEDTLDELQTIVDLGGQVLDVSVEHELYGNIRADLLIQNRLDAAEFAAKMEHCQSQPLKVLTKGVHFHTVTAQSQRNLDLIETALREKGYLAE